LDWDWNVRIADFGHSISPAEPLHSSEICNWPSVDFLYLAPECYDRHYFPESDAFSFGLILYELLVGQSAFGKELKKESIACQVFIEKFRPKIPKFAPDPRLLSIACQVITDCWVPDPDE
jgi:serine/threonine protein kinase